MYAVQIKPAIASSRHSRALGSENVRGCATACGDGRWLSRNSTSDTAIGRLSDRKPACQP